MKIRWFLAAMLLVSSVGVLSISGCSDDDTPVDPNAGLHQINIRLRAGDEFTYDRWPLDINNQRVELLKHDYEITHKAGVGISGPYTDWFYRIGRDMVTQQRDTLFIRTETITRDNGSNYTQDVMARGFSYAILTDFIETVQMLGDVGHPTIPSPKWEKIAMYYDGSGNPRPVGYEWFLTSENGEQMNFNYGATTIPVNAIIKAKYSAREEVISANNKEILTWKTTVTATFDIMNSLTMTVVLHIWFSDNPDAQIKIVQESSTVDIPFIGTLEALGEEQLVKSWIDF